jgi:hypothetical protein
VVRVMKIAFGLLAGLLGVAGGAPQTAPLGVSVVAYGAAPDNRTDSTTAIQRAVDDVATHSGGGRIVFPSGQGCYVVSAPLMIRVPGVFLEGEANRAFNDSGPCLRAEGFVGPLLHITNPANQANLSLTSSLVPGPGQALATMAAGQNTATYIDLQDASAPAQLDGLPAFTVELFFRITTAPARGAGPVVLLASFGNLGPNEKGGYAFGLEVSEALELTGRMTVGGEAARVGGFVLSLNTVYHTALTYDGASVRLFVGTPGRPSTLVGTVAARGPVTQAPFEMMPIGGRRSPWPRGGPYTNPIDGVMDSIRLSRTARYTASFDAPTAKLPFDADTLILENFDREASGDWSIVRTSLGGLTYLPKYGTFTGALLGNIEVSHLELRPGYGQAIWAYAVLTSSFHDLSFVGGTFGFTGVGNFLNRFDNIHLTSTGPHGRVGLDLSGGVSGITSVRNLTFTAWAFGIVQDSGSSAFDSLYFHGDKQVIPMVLRHGSYVVTSTSFSIEDADPRPYVANLLLVDNPNVAIVGGEFERFFSPGPAVQVDGGKATTFTAVYARPHPNATEIIRVVAPTTNRILILNGYTDQPGVPWTASPRDVSVLPQQ